MLLKVIKEHNGMMTYNVINPLIVVSTYCFRLALLFSVQWMALTNRTPSQPIRSYYITKTDHDLITGVFILFFFDFPLSLCFSCFFRLAFAVARKLCLFVKLSLLCRVLTTVFIMQCLTEHIKTYFCIWLSLSFDIPRGRAHRRKTHNKNGKS